MSDKQPHLPDQLAERQVPYLIKSIKYLGSAQVELDHSKELDRMTGCAIVEKSIIKMKESGKQSAATAANLPWVKVFISIDGFSIEDPKTEKVEHKFRWENVAYFGPGTTVYRENRPKKKYFAFLVKGTEGYKEYSRCFVFLDLSDEFAEMLQDTVKQAMDIAYEKFPWEKRDGDKQNQDEEKDKEGVKEKEDKSKKVVDRNDLLEEENKVLKARLKDVATMANEKQLRAYMDKNKIEDLTNVELESIEVPTLNISAPMDDVSICGICKMLFETNSCGPQPEILQNNSEHDFDAIRQQEVMRYSLSSSTNRICLPKSDSWTNLDFDLRPVSLSSPGSSDNSLSTLSTIPNNNFQAGPSNAFTPNLAVKQPMGVKQILCSQCAPRPSSCPPFQGESFEETHNKLSSNFTNGSPYEMENSISNYFSNTASIPTSNLFPMSATNPFPTNRINSCPATAINPFTSTSTNLFPTTANNPLPATANNPFTGVANNPIPITASNPFLATGNNPFL